MVLLFDQIAQSHQLETCRVIFSSHLSEDIREFCKMFFLDIFGYIIFHVACFKQKKQC